MKPNFLTFVFAALVVAAIGAIAACANLNPLAVAETPAQKAYALERSYNILLEQSLEVARNNPGELRLRIQQVEARTTPIIDSLSDAIAAYEIERAKFEEGQTPAERVTVVAENLESWLSQARRALLDLSAVLE